MTDKPHFIARKFQDAQRLGPKGYICPLCDERFQAEPKLWAHAKAQHQQDLNAAGGTDETELRNKFRHEATEKTYVNAAILQLQERRYNPGSVETY